jgi:hypothetical protein
VNLKFANEMSGVWITEINGKRIPRSRIYWNPDRVERDAVHKALSNGLLTDITRVIMEGMT